MKKSLKLITLLSIVLFSTSSFAEELGLKVSNMNLYAPAAKSKKSSGSGGGIEKGTMQLDVSFNLGNHGGFGGAFRGTGLGVGFVPGVTINFDYAVHPYASVGGYVGFGARRKVAGIGVGARGVFHIYQLISDKAGTKVDPGKLDFYFPFHIGAIIATSKGGGTGAGATAGGGLGVRYYFTNNVGVMAEVGWLEMSVAKIGAAFKF
jgi:hypothetical protein